MRPRGRTRHSVRFVFLSRVMFQSPCPYNLAISQSRNNGLLAASGGGAESQNNGENLPGGDRNQRFAVGVRQEEASQCKKNAHAFFHLNATPKEH